MFLNPSVAYFVLACKIVWGSDFVMSLLLQQEKCSYPNVHYIQLVQGL